MIPKQELLEFATDYGLAPDVVEKDYALGWVLAALGQHPETGDTWLFKGGTCLKKCFFETYRFSEDLDFTLLEPGHLDEAFLLKIFNDIAAWVYDETGMVLPPEARKAEVYKNPRGGKSAEGRIGYRGPLGRAADAPRIKLDLTDDERIVLDPDSREVHHPYSDRPTNGIRVTTYCFEEVFAEKIRALAERLRPRDLYDVVHLYRRHDLTLEHIKIITTLQSKCEFKGIDVPTLQSIRESPRVAELQVSWSQMLAHQLPALPSFESFWDELPDVFAWLYETKAKLQLSAIPGVSGESVDFSWHPPSMATSWRSVGISAPMEIIRFAAVNHMCVALDYQDEKGKRGVRIIEPYSVRRSSAGDVLLMAIKADSGEPRSYRIDRIIGATATQKAFTPRYLIEFSDGASLAIPGLGRTLADKRIPSLTSKISPRRPASSFTPKGPVYAYRCTVCGKIFKRQSYNPKLNPHKNKSGQPCFGRLGSLVNTRY